jgi:hypothetical protein
MGDNMRIALATVAAVSLPFAAPAQAVWARLYPAQTPTRRYDALVACREATGDVLLLFGRADHAGGTLSDGWRFDGTTWIPLTGTLPPQRLDSVMVYDSARDRVVLFGGLSGSTRLQDTWEWNGASWGNPNPAVKPPPRRAHAMAFDRKRAVTVLFGGDGTQAFLNDLWEWNGTAWTDHSALFPPAGGPGNHMCFDPSHENVLLFNGLFWSWDGASWQQYFPLIPPLGGAIVADLHRRRVVMPFGNGDEFTWEWDGAQWDIRLQASPFYRDTAAVAYDPTRRRVVVFGGSSSASGVTDDTWIFRTPSPADAVAYGSGCAGTAGVPQLANVPYSLPWLGDTFASRVSNLAPAVGGVIFATGLAPTSPTSLSSFGMPGCDQLVAPAVTEFRPATAGAANWTLAIPNVTAFAGVHVWQQAFPLDTAANPAGLVASNGIDLTVGIR